MTKALVRSATPDDLPGVLDLYRHLHPHDPQLETAVAERVWGVSLRYDLGGSHPLVGRSAPDFGLVDGTRLGDLLREGRGLFLDFDSRAPLQALARRWSGRITYVAGAPRIGWA